MSSDNGYVIRQNAEGKYVLQMYFASDDSYPPISAVDSIHVFDTLEEAISHYNNDEVGYSEYGLTIAVPILVPTEKRREKMTLDIKKFDRKPFNVEAVRVTEENIEEVARWCKGEVNEFEGNRHPSYIKVNVKHPLSQRQTKAFVGDWVLSSKRGFKVYTDAALNHSFDPSEEDIPQELFTTNQLALDLEEKTDGNGVNVFETKKSDWVIPNDVNDYRNEKLQEVEAKDQIGGKR